ncbi:MAG: helix-turn-helix domain-containing protein [Crocinitomicaceae bacterium]
MENVILIIGFGAILQGLFLSGLYIFSEKHKSTSNKILGLFLFALIWEGINSFLPVDQVGNYSLGYYFGLPESKLFMPTLFFHYVLLKVGNYDKYKIWVKLAYALGIIVAFLTVINMVSYLSIGKDLKALLGVDKMEFLFMTQQVIAYGLSVVFLVFSFLEVKKVQIAAGEFYSDPDKLKIDWLKRFVILFVPMVALWGLELVRIFLELPEWIAHFVTINWLLIFILLYYISFKAFTHEDLFRDFKRMDEELDSVSDALDESIIIEMENQMQTHQYFKNEDLNLYDFSKAVNVSPRKISESIKKHRNTNFSTWVNTFRVNLAIEMIQKDSLLSIEGIGQEVGFKSRSALYGAFKKIKDKSPGDFK